jgi:pimeloyl-ACP methyl ester carboxylesterase
MMPKVLQEGYLKANNDKKGLLNMFNKDVQKMKFFKDWTDAQMKSIDARTLIISGTNDVGSVEHAVQMYRVMPNCELAILPGGHGAYLGALEALAGGKWTKDYIVNLITEFLG